MACKNCSPPFLKTHPGQICLITLLDDKSIVKRRFPLHGHGNAINDPTIVLQPPSTTNTLIHLGGGRMKGPPQLLFGCIPFHLCTIHHILCRINAVKELVRSQSPANNSSASRYSPPGTRRSGSGLRCVQQLVADSVVLSARWELRRNPKRLSGSLFVENLYIFCGKYAMQLRNMYKFYTYNGYFLFLF